MMRLCVCGIVAFIISMVFRAVLAVDKQNIQEGFAIASYILTVEALTISTFRSQLDWANCELSRAQDSAKRSAATRHKRFQCEGG